MFILHYIVKYTHTFHSSLSCISHDNNYNNLKFIACCLADFMGLLTIFVISETRRFIIHRDSELYNLYNFLFHFLMRTYTHSISI